MGGDFAPFQIVKGAYAAACKGVPIALFGPVERVTQELDKIDRNWRTKPLTVVDAPDLIEMSDEPVQAIRKKPQSSLVQAVKSVKLGTCSAVVSAGSSGALMAASLLILGRTEGVERPAIIGFVPTQLGKVVCLDLGANVDCKPHYLVQFARLGADYAQQQLAVINPRIGLLSNGTEPGKGTVMHREAYELLEQSGLNFVGNIEPHEIAMHAVDVVVTDGFSGNIMLKTMEATASMLISMIKQQLADTDSEMIERVMKTMSGVTSVADQGGALLVGVSGVVVVAHGNSDARACESAILYAHKHI